MTKMETTTGRIFRLTVRSARDLELVRTPLRKMRVYAMCTITISGDEILEEKTPVDKDGELNPSWNHHVEYELPNDVLEDQGAMLVIKLYCKRRVGDDIYIGEVNKSVKDVFSSAQGNSGSLELDMPLQKGSVGRRTSGMVKFSVTLGEERSIRIQSLWRKRVAKASKIVGLVIGQLAIGVASGIIGDVIVD